MKPRYLITLVLFVIALTLVAQNGQGEERGGSLVYSESLDRVAAQLNGSELTLRDMAFYVIYEETLVEREAEVYDSENPSRYWNARVEGGFVWSVARKSAIRMAIHDELFYQMATDEGLTLNVDEKETAGLMLDDVWADLIDRGGEEKLGIEKEELVETVEHIALAQKYQDIYAQMYDKSYEDYEFTGDAYTKLLEKQDYSIDENVWNKVGMGTVTL
jgi:hypothetical protein